MKLIEWVKIALLFLYVTSKLPVYKFKIVWVVLHLSVKEIVQNAVLTRAK